MKELFKKIFSSKDSRNQLSIQPHILLSMIYTEILPGIREIGKEHGYAIAIHGSLLNDFDLIAVKWQKNCSSKEKLVEAICKKLYENKPKNEIYYDLIEESTTYFEDKGYNRYATIIPLCVGVAGARIDLSVIGV